MRILLCISIFLVSFSAYAHFPLAVTLPNAAPKGSVLVLPVAQSRYPNGIRASLVHDQTRFELTAYAASHWPDGSLKTITLSATTNLPVADYLLQLTPINQKLNAAPKLAEHELVDYTVDKTYLQATGFHTTARQVTDSDTLSWFHYGAEQYAKTIVTNPEMQTSTSAWLYDYPATLYGLYFVTGDTTWKHAAHKAAQEYASHIDIHGFYDRKPNDTKYLAPLGLYLDSLLYPYAANPSHHALTRLYQASLNWDPDYGPFRGFWTERHQAAALMVAVVHWERTQTPAAHARVEAIINATHKMIFEPITNQVTGCAAHRHQSHEGSKKPYAVCSPWMSVLLADGLWRYWRLTGDTQSANMIKALGDFILNIGTYQVKRKYGQLTVPYYLKSLEPKFKLEINGWTDVQHNCDVASLLVRAGYMHKQAGSNSQPYRLLADELLKGCERETIKNRTPDKKPRPWPISPLRKFNWWYNVPADLPWVYSRLD